jgi:hypothetical protein
MIRTAENLITGPYSTEEIRSLVREGKLRPQDEICQANDYWIFLHESDELIKKLGVALPAGSWKRGSNDDITETETETETVTATPTGRPRAEAPIPDLPDLPPEGSGSTVTRAMSRAQTKIHIPHAIGQIERSSAWKGLAFLLMVASGVIVLLVIRLLKTGL